MKKAILKKFKNKIQKMINEIDEIGTSNEIPTKEKENTSGEALWSAQSRLEEAIEWLNEGLE